MARGKHARRRDEPQDPNTKSERTKPKFKHLADEYLAGTDPDPQHEPKRGRRKASEEDDDG